MAKWTKRNNPHVWKSKARTKRRKSTVMAKKGKRGGTRTVVKYVPRAPARRGGGGRARRAVSSLAKERGMTSMIGLAIGYVDAKKNQGQYAFLAKLPTIGGAGWEFTAGAALHLYHGKNRGAKWADQASTALLAIAAYKFGRAQGGSAIAGNSPGDMAGWIPGNR